MDEYICKMATLEEMEQNWNYLIEIHPDNNAWKIYSEFQLEVIHKYYCVHFFFKNI